MRYMGIAAALHKRARCIAAMRSGMGLRSPINFRRGGRRELVGARSAPMLDREKAGRRAPCCERF
jgi:hypothetical protein